MMVESLKLNKSITIQQTKGSLKVKIPINRDYISTIAFLLLLITWVAIGGTNLYKFSTSNPIVSSVFLTVLWLVTAFFLTDRFFLFLNSYEEIIIESGLLSVQRKGVLQKRKKSFVIEDISSFRIDNFRESIRQPEHPRKGKRPYIDGIIKFNYKFKEESIGIGLEEEEAVELLDALVLKNIFTNDQWLYKHKPKSTDDYLL